MIQCVCLNPAFQRTLTIEQFSLNTVNRVKGPVLESSAGKGINVARVLNLLGPKEVITGFCGGPTGELLQQYLSKEGLAYDFVQTAHKTRICTTLIDTSNMTHTELVEEGASVSAEEISAMYRIYEKHLQECQLVTISGTAPRQTPETIYREFVTMAREQHIPTLVDTQKSLLKECLKARPFLIKVNREELETAFQQSLNSADSLYGRIRQIQNKGVEWIVITQGGEKTLAFHQEHLWEITPPVIQAVNPIGAGDAMLGGIAAALYRGDNVLQAVCFGIACGTASALTLTPGMLRPEDLEPLTNEVSVKQKM